MTEYPHDRRETMSFDEVTRYTCGTEDSLSKGDVRSAAIVTYGNGVVTALQAVAVRSLPPSLSDSLSDSL